MPSGSAQPSNHQKQLLLAGRSRQPKLVKNYWKSQYAYYCVFHGQWKKLINYNVEFTTLYFHYLKCGYETAGKLQWQPQTPAILVKSGIFSKEGEIIIKLLKKSSRVQKILISGVPMRFRANKLRATKSKWNSQPVCRFLRQTLICLIFGYSLHLNVL